MNELGHGPWEKGYEPSGINSNLPIYECGFNQGYKKAEKDTLEKAVSWMDSVLPNVTDRETIEWLINDFRKAMEDEK